MAVGRRVDQRRSSATGPPACASRGWARAAGLDVGARAPLRVAARNLEQLRGVATQIVRDGLVLLPERAALLYRHRRLRTQGPVVDLGDAREDGRRLVVRDAARLDARARLPEPGVLRLRFQSLIENGPRRRDVVADDAVVARGARASAPAPRRLRACRPRRRRRRRAGSSPPRPRRPVVRLDGAGGYGLVGRRVEAARRF